MDNLILSRNTSNAPAMCYVEGISNNHRETAYSFEDYLIKKEMKERQAKIELEHKSKLEKTKGLATISAILFEAIVLIVISAGVIWWNSPSVQNEIIKREIEREAIEYVTLGSFEEYSGDFDLLYGNYRR